MVVAAVAEAVVEAVVLPIIIPTQPELSCFRLFWIGLWQKGRDVRLVVPPGEGIL